jgi:hypothetical protein
MRLTGQSGDRNSAKPAGVTTQAESLRQMRRQLLIESVQHPASLLPLAAGVLAGLFLLTVAPLLGGGIWALLILAVCASVAIAALCLRYVSEYEVAYSRWEAQRAATAEDQKEKSEEEAAERLKDSLRVGFMAIESSLGVSVLEQLAGVYGQLQPVISERRNTDPLSMAALPAMATETYRQGLSVLWDALQVMTASEGPDVERLQQEIVGLIREVKDMEGDSAQAERLAIKQATLQSRRDRLAMLGRLQLRADQLLHQAGRCVDSLHRTRSELVAIRAGGSESTVDLVTDALRRTVTQVKEVQEELAKLGYGAGEVSLIKMAALTSASAGLEKARKEEDIPW